MEFYLIYFWRFELLYEFKISGYVQTTLKFSPVILCVWDRRDHTNDCDKLAILSMKNGNLCLCDQWKANTSKILYPFDIEKQNQQTPEIKITDIIIVVVVVVVAEIYGIYCEYPAQNGVERDIQQRNMLNWVAVQKRIAAVDSMTNHAHIGLWDLKPSTDCSIGASIRWCIANVMTGTHLLHSNPKRPNANIVNPNPNSICVSISFDFRCCNLDFEFSLVVYI